MVIEQVDTKTEYGALGPPERIVSNLLEEHHGFLRRELPLLLRLMRRVQREECNLAVRSKLEELIELFKVFRYSQEHHMLQEEREIFPRLLNGLAGESLEQTVQIIGHEHQTFRFVFERFYEMLNVIEKELMHCKSYRALRERLTVLASRSREHIWLEEQLLAMLLVASHEWALVAGEAA